jgi:hypothetical protein
VIAFYDAKYVYNLWRPVTAIRSAATDDNPDAQPPGDTYALDQTKFEQDHDASTGLGPVFNARACADCHQNPVSGGSSQFTEIRAGHLDKDGNFVAATVPINDGASTIANRSIINDRALIPQAQEHIPDTENIRALRAALNTLGDGFERLTVGGEGCSERDYAGKQRDAPFLRDGHRIDSGLFSDQFDSKQVLPAKVRVKNNPAFVHEFLWVRSVHVPFPTSTV